MADPTPSVAADAAPSPTEPVPGPGWDRNALAGLLLVTALTFARLWWVELSWDDEALVKDNQFTESLANIPDFFQRDLWSTTRLSWLKSGYYRPFMLISLAVDRALYGLSSMGAHIHSLLWHLGAVAALFTLLRRLTGPLAALAGATLFAVHPVQTEVLALVAARNDSMAAVFVLSALLLVLDLRTRSPLRLVGASLLVLAGLLSKESAVLAPFMLVAIDLARQANAPLVARVTHAARVGWPRYLALVASLGVYLPLRSLAQANAAITPSSASFTMLFDHLGSLVGVYGSLLVWPWPLTPARHLHYLPPAGEVLLGAVVTGGLLALAVSKGRHRALVLAGGAWAVVTWLPSLAATLDKGLMGERYLYFPMAGMALCLAAALPKVWPRWVLPAIAVPAILVVQARLPHWQDSRTVWEHAHAVDPTPFTAGGLAWYVHRDEDYDRALPLFDMALSGDPPYRDVCDMIVMAYLQAKKPKRAVEVGRWALEERGCDPRGLLTHHYAIALAGEGEWRTAVEVAMSRPKPIEGPALTVVVADRARVGDMQTVARVANEVSTKDPDLLRRAAKLLKLSGETEASGRIVQMMQGAAPARPTP